MRLSFYGSAIHSQKGMQAHVVSLLSNKRTMLCKYTSDIYMAKYSELTLNQNVVYICICIWGCDTFNGNMSFLNKIDRCERTQGSHSSHIKHNIINP